MTYTVKDYMGGDDPKARTIFMHALRRPVTMLEDMGYPEAYEHRKATFNRLMGYIKEASAAQDENVLLVHLKHDFEAFCAFLIRLPQTDFDTGRSFDGAMYPSIVQSAMKENMHNYRTSYSLVARQVGKSRLCSAYALWYSYGNAGSFLNLLAPSKKQLQVMKDVKAYCEQNKFIRERLVKEKEGGKLAAEHIILGFNGSQILSMTIGQTAKGDYIRGLRGTIILDEFPIVKQEIIEDVIEPLQQQFYEKVRLIYVGTPKLVHNPGLDAKMENAQKRDDIGFFQIGCWEALDLAAADVQGVTDRFWNFRVPCEHAQQGKCPAFWRDGGRIVPPNPKYADFTCTRVCYEYDSIVMENFAEFPPGGNKPFPPAWIYSASDANMHLIEPHALMPPKRARIMSIDIGVLLHPTAIVIADEQWDTEYEQSRLRVIGWYEIPTQRDMSFGSEPHRDKIQRLRVLYNPTDIYIDVTSNEDFVYSLINDGDNPIPKPLFYACETQAKKNSVGIWWGNARIKHEMVTNHRTQLAKGRWVVPQASEHFFERWFTDHTRITAEESSDGSHSLYRHSGHTFDAAIMASMYLSGKGRAAPAFFRVV